MRVIAHLVARNEADRYLDSVLAALPTPYVHLYDDQSTDDTVAIAQRRGAQVRRRPEIVPAFMDDEGAFRQAAWDSMVDTMRPEAGDWVLALDCDEFLVGDGDLADVVSEAILAAQEAGAVGIQLPIPEIWDISRGEPWQRLDGFWAGLAAPRLFAYRPLGRFRRAVLGCGSVPTYVTQGYLSPHTYGLAIAHLGYADVEDRSQKYQRYAGTPGHNPAHILSIRTAPLLGRAPFSLPTVNRGAR